MSLSTVSASIPSTNPLSGGGGKKKPKKLDPDFNKEKIVVALLKMKRRMHDNLKGAQRFNEYMIRITDPTIINPAFFKLFKLAIEGMQQDLFKFSATELSIYSREVYNKVPGLPRFVRPEFAEHLINFFSEEIQAEGFCFPDSEALFRIQEFLNQIGSNGVVEVGFGSGMLGSLIQALGIHYHGHELDPSIITRFIFKKCYLKEGSFTMHLDPNDTDYLIKAAKEGKTLLFCYPESEEYHESLVAYNCLKIYFDACKAEGIKGSIILITDYTGCTDGPKFQEFLEEHFIKFSGVQAPEFFPHVKGSHPIGELLIMK
jgi:hypothetical protein